MKAISQDDLDTWLEDHDWWSFQEPEIAMTIDLQDFPAAMAFITQVAFLAEKHDHHPTIVNTYNTVTLSMATHDAGNAVTDKDLALAEEIEKLLS